MLQRIKDSVAVLLGSKIAVSKNDDRVELEKLIEEIYQRVKQLTKN